MGWLLPYAAGFASGMVMTFVVSAAAIRWSVRTLSEHDS